MKTHGAPAPDQRLTLSASRRASHRKTLDRKSLYRKTLHRRTPKITIIAAGSALALAGIAAGTVAAWPGNSPAASASVAGASFGGTAARRRQTLTGAEPWTTGWPSRRRTSRPPRPRPGWPPCARPSPASEARQEARKAGRAAAAKAAAAQAAARAAARAAPQQQASAAAAPAATPAGSPQQIAEGMLGSYGWSSSQFSCLQPLWNAESGWNVSATNTSSGAYGIPQALPGSKMASAGADWQTDAATQIRWGLGYIRSVYGSPCGAWSHEQAYGWY